jgi:hypothetical protein
LSDSHSGSVEAAHERYSDFVNRVGNLGGDWLNTDDYSVVARSQIVEAGVVEIK